MPESKTPPSLRNGGDKSNTTIRPALVSDSAFIWRLSMDNSVRAMSTRGDYFNFADHDVWFRGKLTNGQNRIWIIEANDIPVGQVRYGIVSPQCCSDEAEVAISVSPNHQGRGYGSELLTTTMPMACDWLRVNTLVALVLKDNSPSRHLFIKAGFGYVGREERMNREHLRYEWSK